MFSVNNRVRLRGKQNTRNFLPFNSWESSIFPPFCFFFFFFLKENIKHCRGIMEYVIAWFLVFSKPKSLLLSNLSLQQLWTLTTALNSMCVLQGHFSKSKLQPAWSWLFLWPQQDPSAWPQLLLPASAALSRWELQILGSVSIPCGCCLLNSHSKFSSLKSGASVFLSLSQMWRESWLRQWSECPSLPGSCLQSNLTISWCPEAGTFVYMGFTRGWKLRLNLVELP